MYSSSFFFFFFLEFTSCLDRQNYLNSILKQSVSSSSCYSPTAAATSIVDAISRRDFASAIVELSDQVTDDGTIKTDAWNAWKEDQRIRCCILASMLGFVDVVELCLPLIDDMYASCVAALMMTAGTFGHVSVLNVLFQEAVSKLGVEEALRLLQTKRTKLSPTHYVTHEGLVALAASRGHANVLEFIATHAGVESLILEAQSASSHKNSTAVVAAENGHRGVLEFLHSCAPYLLESPGVFRTTAAHAAAAGGYVDMLAFLIRHSPSGAAILEREDLFHQTPAMLAAMQGHVTVLEFLVAHAPSGVHLLDKRIKNNGNTCAILAASKGSVDALRFLVKHASPSVLEDQNVAGRTPARIASVMGHLDALKFIVDHAPSGASVLDVVCHDNITCAWAAARDGNLELLTYVICRAPSGTAMLEVANSNHVTPTMIASLFGHADIVNFVASHAPSGVSVLERGNDESTPALIAAHQGHVAVLDTIALRAPRGPLNFMNHIGASQTTPLRAAVQSGAADSLVVMLGHLLSMPDARFHRKELLDCFVMLPGGRMHERTTLEMMSHRFSSATLAVILELFPDICSHLQPHSNSSELMRSLMQRELQQVSDVCEHVEIADQEHCSSTEWLLCVVLNVVKQQTELVARLYSSR